eukprot:1158381-Pelagomonas_calceolata.AAC.4
MHGGRCDCLFSFCDSLSKDSQEHCVFALHLTVQNSLTLHVSSMRSLPSCFMLSGNLAIKECKVETLAPFTFSQTGPVLSEKYTLLFTNRTSSRWHGWKTARRKTP